MRVIPTGPRNAAIMIIGEAPGAEEEQRGEPFVGSSGHELTQMLSLAGIERSSCFITNVFLERPAGNDITLFVDKARKKVPEGWTLYGDKMVADFALSELGRLKTEIQAVRPSVIICLGNTALWAVTGLDSVAKWRGSLLTTEILPGATVIPTYHPAAILRNYPWRAVTVQDLRRAKRESISKTAKPNWTFMTGLPFKEIKFFLEQKLALVETQQTPIVCDLEITRNEILCVGLGFSRTEAICIPFLHCKGFYFSEQEHVEIVLLLKRLLEHHNTLLINQNIAFDIQYLFWRFTILPDAHFDTMVAQNVIFPGTPKALDYLASLYCKYYVYWKDDGKFWKKLVSDDVIWHYNCLDCVYTFEVYEAQQQVLKAANLVEQANFMTILLNRTIRMMLRGVLVNEKHKSTLTKEIHDLIAKLHEEVRFLTRKDLVGAKGSFSSARLAKFFYEDLKFDPIYKVAKGKRAITCDDDALKKLAKKYPWIKPLTDRINVIRSYSTALTVCEKRSDKDDRWRCSFNVAGTANFRFSSSENPFGSGLNLQNLTTGRDIL